jgi:hypothetical protein
MACSISKNDISRPDPRRQVSSYKFQATSAESQNSSGVIETGYWILDAGNGRKKEGKREKRILDRVPEIQVISDCLPPFGSTPYRRKSRGQKNL